MGRTLVFVFGLELGPSNLSIFWAARTIRSTFFDQCCFECHQQKSTNKSIKKMKDNQ
ncbi:hypothetical protein Fmac_017113 [Flemingia macrophylla]|uniref:Uncharacterized protein n=1 Tax=Flemingia macrophylla TaxID=520843 RepID=A0ABD1M166_9FABA